MEKQSNAERLRRAEVLESEGYRQRLINQSEGEKQQAINEASGAAEATRLRARRRRADPAARRRRRRRRARTPTRRPTASAPSRAAGSPGGRDAVQQLAEKCVGELAEMAKQSKLVTSHRPNDERRARGSDGRLRPGEAHMKGAAERPPPEEVDCSLTPVIVEKSLFSASFCGRGAGASPF